MEELRWYSDLGVWRTKNQCNDEKWNMYALAAQNRVKYVSYAVGFWSFMIGIIITYCILKLGLN